MSAISVSRRTMRVFFYQGVKSSGWMVFETNDFVGLGYQVGKFAADGGGVGIIRHTRPVTLVAHERGASAQDQGVRGAQEFGVVVVEGFIVAVLREEILENLSKVLFFCS